MCPPTCTPGPHGPPRRWRARPSGAARHFSAAFASPASTPTAGASPPCSPTPAPSGRTSLFPAPAYGDRGSAPSPECRCRSRQCSTSTPLRSRCTSWRARARRFPCLCCATRTRRCTSGRRARAWESARTGTSRSRWSLTVCQTSPIPPRRRPKCPTRRATSPTRGPSRETCYRRWRART